MKIDRKDIFATPIDIEENSNEKAKKKLREEIRRMKDEGRNTKSITPDFIKEIESAIDMTLNTDWSAIILDRKVSEDELDKGVNRWEAIIEKLNEENKYLVRIALLIIW